MRKYSCLDKEEHEKILSTICPEYGIRCGSVLAQGMQSCPKCKDYMKRLRKHNRKHIPLQTAKSDEGPLVDLVPEKSPEIINVFKESFKEASKAKIIRTIVKTFKSRPCADCGSVPANLEYVHFDHRPETVKLFNIADAYKRTSVYEVLQEIAKCDVVCIVCHAKRTQERAA